MSKSKTYLCVHGHFYQPPRENPWLEAIEIQESAAPFHDWNERIHHECYQPNALARVIDHHGKIVNIINNYETINFNIGPTLMSWIREKEPETYRKILEADKSSIERFNGHGSAIAQTYNHMIMPLANKRDKETQIIWGIEDFKFHFGRQPESIWLPETACNEATLETLVEAGIKYIILSPHQAQSVKPIGEKDEAWTDVGAGNIDPKQPYRCFLQKHPKKYIDIFFYDGPISKDIGFGDILKSSSRFAERILHARSEGDGNQLISVATDGETYGHHKAYGDRVLAYALAVEAGERDIHVTNYSQFLENHPPVMQVQIKEGENGEGTAWSCAEGVKRWKDHTADCEGTSPEGWNQNWRRPLRESLDWLRDQAAKIFEEQSASLFKDGWAARNDYIHVVLNRSQENVEQFFSKHQRHQLSPSEKITALKLLEMQRHAMLMFTSCGWFFEEVSRIETTQILAYAARVAELAYDCSEKNLEEEFLSKFAAAESNLPIFKDGRDLFDRVVRPRIVTWELLVNYYAMMSTFNDQEQAKAGDYYCFHLDVLSQRTETFGSNKLNYGTVRVQSKITFEEKEFAFVAVQLGPYDFRCSVTPKDHLSDPNVIEKELFDQLHTTHVVEILRKIDAIFGKKYYALKDLPVEQRTPVVAALTQDVLKNIADSNEKLYDETRRMNEIFRAMNLSIPREVKDVSKHALEEKLFQAVSEIASAKFEAQKHTIVDRLLEEAEAFGVELNKTKVSDLLSAELEIRTEQLVKVCDQTTLEECLLIFDLSSRVRTTLDLFKPQNHLFYLLKSWQENPVSIPTGIKALIEPFKKLLEGLKISEEQFLITVDQV